MRRDEVLEKIIDGMALVSYTLSDEAHGVGLTEFFNIYLDSVELRDLVLEKSSKLLGYRYPSQLKGIYDIGISLHGIEDVFSVDMGIVENMDYYYKICFNNKHESEWYRDNIEKVTRGHINKDWLHVEEAYDSYMIKEKIVGYGLKCFSWSDGEGCYMDMPFFVNDECVPF